MNQLKMVVDDRWNCRCTGGKKFHVILKIFWTALALENDDVKSLLMDAMILLHVRVTLCCGFYSWAPHWGIGQIILQKAASSITGVKDPVKNLSSQLTHCKLTWKLMAISLWKHSSTSQLTHELISHCDLAVSLPWVCISHRELAVTCSWDQPISSPCSGSIELTVISLLTSQWDIQVSPLCVLR